MELSAAGKEEGGGVWRGFSFSFLVWVPLRERRDLRERDKGRRTRMRKSACIESCVVQIVVRSRDVGGGGVH
jgi:hypothetical protein